jgi:hypothetical protein
MARRKRTLKEKIEALRKKWNVQELEADGGGEK